MYKKLLFPVFSILFFLLINSTSHSSSILNLSLYNGERFSVILNNNVPSEFTIEYETTNLNAGQYFLKVIPETISPGVAENPMFSDYINLVDGYKIYAVITIDQKFYVYKKVLYNNIYGNIENRNKCTCNCECCRNCPKCNPNYINNDEFECKYKVINETDFNILKATVEKRSFEETRKELIISAIDANYFTSAQVKTLLLLFSFENSKLEVAKYAYNKTCDKKNYFVVYDVFTFENSIPELKKYIESNK